MSYQHLFYAVDLDRLKGLYGSADEALVEEVVAAQAEAIEDNDAFFEDEIEEGEVPSTEAALREIVSADAKREDAEAMYGYALKILCEHLGEMIGEDVYAVRDHPYKSRLVRSGPPLPIPYDGADFPEIGYLALSDLPAEIQRIDAAPRKAKKSLVLTLLSSLTGGMIGKQMNDEEAIEDMGAYRATLQEAIDKKRSIVSFRH